MRNNPGENIKTDWQINEIVKPGHVNALTKAIKYDYVVTADKVTKKSSLDDEPDDLYELCGSPAEVDADISILINTTMGVTLRGVSGDDSEYIVGPLFKIDPSDFVSSSHSVHIYALCNGVWGGFGIKVEGYRTVLIHTSGKRNAAIFLPGSERRSESGIYVGSAWDMDQIDNSAPRSGIVYEQTCDGKLPQGDVTHSAWMSNAVGGGSDGILRIFDTVAKKNQGLQYMRMVLGNDILAEVTGQDLKVGPRGSISDAYQTVPGLGYNKDRSAFIDMSEMSGIDWTTWFTADMEGYRIWGNSRDYWDVTNPYTEMAIDTASMVIGRVYAVKIHVAKNLHDTLDPYATTSINTTGKGTKQLRFSQSQGEYALQVNGSWPMWVSRSGWPPINGTITGGIALQTAAGRWPGGDYPAGVSGADVVMDITIGGATSTCIFQSNDNDKPKASATTTTIATTVHANVDGEIYVEFSCDNKSGYSRYYEIIIPPDYLIGASVDTQFSIPTVQWKERMPLGDGNYEWQDRDAFLLLAPLDGRPRFYSPYLLAQGGSGDYGWSYLKPKFHPVHSESRDMDPNGSSDPSHEEDYDPETPAYEASVYLCRIDDTHVLVLGY